jgi:hypothetical protein
MIKRATWFGVGVVTGVLGAAWTYTKVREARGKATADALAETVAENVVNRVRDSVHEGITTMRETRANLLSEGRDAQ